MEFSRREYCLVAVGGAALPLVYWSLTSRGILHESNSDVSAYRSTLVNGLTPAKVPWSERDWTAAMGSTWHPGMSHCLRVTRERARFEIRNTEYDRSSSDPPTKRRSEIRNPKRPRLPNGIPIWGATSFLHHRWADPSGMANTWGGVHGQVHIGSSFGGSPALAFRRTGRGEFAVTTRGEHDPRGTMHYRGSVGFDEPHDLVYRLVLHPSNGSIAVWLDGQNIVDVTGASIGSSEAECYWSIGCYYGGGITCPIVAEYGNHVYPGTVELGERISARPEWPRS